MNNKTDHGQWISVNDARPALTLHRYEDDQEPSGFTEFYASEPVLVFLESEECLYPGRIQIGEYCVDALGEQFSVDGHPTEVTHWMPLPNEPI